MAGVNFGVNDDLRSQRQLGPVRAELVSLMLFILAGIAAGVAWRYLLPFFLHHSDRQESFFVVDGSLAVIQVVAGLITGVLLVIWPGRKPAWRAGTGVIGSLIAGSLAWLTGLALGTPVLKSTGVVLIWAVAASLTVFLASMLPITGPRFNPPQTQTPP